MSELGSNNIGELAPGIAIPGSHCIFRVVVCMSKNVPIQGEPEARAGRQVTKALGRFFQLPDPVPERPTPDEQPGGVVRVQPSIL